MENQAAFLHSPGTPLKVEPAPLTQPAPHEVLISNHAIAINPVDYKQQDTGIMISKFPYILGMDIAGTVVSVGSDITAFKPGDRIASIAPALPTQNQTYAAFQLYTLVPGAFVSHIPDKVAFTDAVVLPLGLTTASYGLFEPQFLGIDPPSAFTPSPPENCEKVVLVWGASGSVGSCAVQLAAAAGLTVLATASAKNFEYVKDLGATQVFDYNDADLLEKLVGAARGKTVVGAYDAITSDATTLACAEYLHAFGGGKVFCSLSNAEPPELPEGVARVAGRPSQRADDGGPPIWQRVWADFMGEGLKNGKLKTQPEALVLKGGLERLNEGVDLVRKGTSARKIVVQISG